MLDHRAPQERMPSSGAFSRIRQLYRSTCVDIVKLLAPRWHIARLMPLAGRRLVAAAALLDVVLGLLPVVFVAATSVLLGRVPAAVRAGIGSSGWRDLVAALVAAAAAVIGQQVLAPVQAALGELITRRVDVAVFHRLMAASLGAPGIAG